MAGAAPEMVAVAVTLLPSLKVAVQGTVPWLAPERSIAVRPKWVTPSSGIPPVIVPMSKLKSMFGDAWLSISPPVPETGTRLSPV